MNWLLPGVFIVCYAVFLVYRLFIPFGPYGLTTALDWDEGFGTSTALKLLEERTILIGGFYDWGPFYFYMEAAAFALYDTVSAVAGFDVGDYLDYEPYVIVSRFLSLFFTTGALAVLYVYAKNTYGRSTAVLAVLFTATVPVFQRYAVTVRPDAPNVFFVVTALSAAALSLRGQRRLVYFAAASAGFSFTVKLTGLTLLPFIIVAAAAPFIGKTYTGDARFRRILLITVLVVTIFIAAALISAPVIVLDPVGFAKGFYHVSYITTSGLMFKYSANPLLWLPKILSLQNGGPVIPVVFVATCVILAAWAFATRRLRAFEVVLSPRVLPVAWAFVYFLFFFLLVRNRMPRYVLPVLPFFALTTAFVLTELARRRPIYRALAVGTVAVALIASVYSSATALVKLKSHVESARSVAEWFELYVKPGSAVGKTHNAYAPSYGYEDVRVHSLDDLYENRPAVLVTDSTTEKTYENPNRASDLQRGEKSFNRFHKLFKALTEGEADGYYEAAAFGRFTIYAREDVGPGESETRAF
ncbi:MAG: glycosyltransferase family 39 protein [Candidatus Coatesbacteria bacterium]|nr:MAG: glycosyltransferase family 39 protein [Candidatus Coatesbacteria bacterium]UCE27399.1 MAG: glycosyltransferase family 39 protein [Candidatus Coatesbacteria bacterium]